MRRQAAEIHDCGMSRAGNDGLGQRIRQLRIKRRLSLRGLAERSASSPSFISQLERGLTGASTASLNQIASALGVSVALLFEPSPAVTAGVLRRRDRPALPPSHGCRKTLLTRPPLSDMEVYVGEFEIGGSTGPDLYTHGDAHEMLVVVRGIVEVSLGEVRHVLEEGDSIEYATSTPHRAENIGNALAEVMWIIAPPTSGGNELEQYVALEVARGRAAPASEPNGALE